MLTRDQLLNKEIILARKCHFAVGLRDAAGANIRLEVFLKGALDPETELSVNLSEVENRLQEFVRLVDHKDVGAELRTVFTDSQLRALKSDKLFLAKAAWIYLLPRLQFEYAAMESLKMYFGDFEVITISGARQP